MQVAMLDNTLGMAYHSEHCSRLLGTNRLDCLEHIHHSFCLTLLGYHGDGTEHTRPSHCVTGWGGGSIM